MSNYLFLFLLFLSFVRVKAQNTTYAVKNIDIEGVKRTKESFCKDFLECTKQQSAISEEMIERDVQKLWNLGLFADVRYEISESETGEQNLVFKVKEKFYWLPIVGIDFSDENLRFTLGALNFNLDGRGSFLKAAWSYYDRHSFELTFANPHLFSKKWGSQLEFSRWATLEPTQTYENSAYTRANSFNVTKWNAGALAFFSPKFRQTIYFGGNFLNERYQEVVSPTENIEAIDFTTSKVLAKIGAQLNNIDYYYHWRSGWQAMSGFETVYTFEPSAWFWKFVSDFRYYKRIGENHNFMLRGIYGISTNEPMPFPAFVQDNFVNLRGVGNRIGRGPSEITLNVEWHTTVLFRNDVGAIALALFTDASSLTPIGGKNTDFFTKPLSHITTGGGIRLHAFKFYQGVLRIDYGLDVLNPKNNGFVLGLGHFF